MTVTTALETGLYAKLSTAAALITELGGTAIYNKLAPQSPGSKYVVFQWQGGGDVNDHPKRSRDVLYTVQGVALTQAAAAAIDDDIDAALHNQSLTVSGWTAVDCQRENDINYVEMDSGGVARYHCGGIYRIRIEAT